LNGKEYTEKQFYKPKKLTLDEIIDILGYPIIIVKSHWLINYRFYNIIP